ncbi:MAG: hypothetical protein HWE10_08175 [Gammaproteobacteria bacterium]|nr:hypothetical protein [Gammaproteobacteria bacterium]
MQSEGNETQSKQVSTVSELEDVVNTNQAQKELLEKLVAQSEAMNEQLAALNNHQLITAYDSIPKLLLFQLLKGGALGLGSVLGATVVLSFVVYMLSQIEFIPVIGEWVSAILDTMKETPDN